MHCKKRIKGILGIGLLAILLVGMTGCGKEQQDKTTFTVYTSVYPVYDLTVKLAGDAAKVENLVPAGVEPHDFEMGTQDMVKLTEADLLVYCGAGMENWVEQALKTLGNEAPKSVMASEGVSLLSEEDTEDPHIWLDPKNAAIMLENIRHALCEADPAHEDVYTANYEKYQEKLMQLDAAYKTALGQVTKHDIVVSHASFGYLCAAYGLKQTAIEGLMADSEPDPATMTKIIAFMKEQEIPYIFDEELVNNKVVDTIAKETGATVAILDPVEGLSQERIDAGEEYFSIMENNLELLKQALK